MTILRDSTMKATDLIRLSETLLLNVINSIDNEYGSGKTEGSHPDISPAMAQTLALCVIAYKLKVQE